VRTTQPPKRTNPRIVEYYDRRLAEYDDIYRRPERQADLTVLAELLRHAVENARVLELACGTGHWTAIVAETAAHVTATDVSPKALEAARARIDQPHVHFRLADARAIDAAGDDFTTVLAAFWWSHVPRADVPRFLRTLTTALGPGTRAIFIDNRYVDGSSTPISRSDSDGNTYQLRRLADGTEFEILKNFPTREELHSSLTRVAADIDIHELTHYWYATCTLRAV
jgi:demethylmenaquinone methyltransferase/2-methoxy-6-polyprenyl-1,4-benzoquinol methylase